MRRVSVTPARMPLLPGTYNATLEERQANTQSVEAQNGELNLLKIPLE